MKPYLSVVIPAYNERDNLKRGVLSEVFKFLEKKEFSWEVIVSDDGSTDGSRDLVKKQIKKWKNFKLLENPHGGKPSALCYGIKAADGKYLLFTDMDQSTPISEFDKLRPSLEGEYDAVIGSRGLQRKNFPVYRRIGSIVFMAIRKLFILPEINDTQCGFKLFRASVVKKAFPKLEFFRKKGQVEGWRVTSYDVELLHIIKKMGKRIREVGVDWEEKGVDKKREGSLGRYVRESKEMLFEIIKVKLNDLHGTYDG